MRQIGHYTIIDEIGRGGQATVYLAEDSRLKRKVALKVLGEEASTAQETVDRFRREAELASRLDHPGICPVYEAGVADGVPFIAMRLLEGETLAHRIARAASAGVDAGASVHHDASTPPPSSGAALDSSTAGRPRLTRDEILDNALIIEKVARALHAAHELGVVHRDIKPANIMVSPGGDPVLLDLGLARDESADHQTLTRTGDVFGTPAYMSPEQLTGQRIRADRRTDVYALGATLYEATTLRRPFEAPTREALYQAILTENPYDARRLNPRIPAELKIVMETALEKSRNRRYQTALALAEDLARIRKMEPIRARAPGPLLRFRRWIQRKPATAASVLGLIVALGLLGYAVGAVGRARSEEALKKQAIAERDRADAALARLAAADRATALRQSLTELEMHYGTIAHGGPQVLGPDATIDYKPLCRKYLAAYVTFGLPLSSPDGPAASQRVLESLRRSEPVLHREITDSFETFRTALRMARAAERDDDLFRAWRSVDAIAVPNAGDALSREVRIVEKEWRETGEDNFGRLLNEESLQGLSPADLGRLGATLLMVPGRRPDAMRLIDRALERDPASYWLHSMRGGTALGLARQDPAELERAILHCSIARALRPRSALACGFLAYALAIRQDLDGAVAQMEEATRLEGDSALIWLIAADFYMRVHARDKAIAAARRANEIDPSLAKPLQILKDLGATESR